jgi:tRNA(adenine34) deaminase
LVFFRFFSAAEFIKIIRTLPNQSLIFSCWLIENRKNQGFQMSEETILSIDQTDERFMRMAIDQAYLAEENGDVPIGCVVVHQGRVIAKGCNQRELLHDPTAHAEIIALTQAAEYIGNWRLEGCTIYVTLEPCPMCAGALVLGRLDRLVYGTDDPKTGAVKSLYNIVQDSRLNHRLEVTQGVLQAECQQQLQAFFRRRRQENNQQ